MLTRSRCAPYQDDHRAALSPEIWDAAGSADARPSHHHHPPVAPLPDVLGHLLQALPLLACAAAASVGEKAAGAVPDAGLSARKQQFYAESLMAPRWIYLLGGPLGYLLRVAAHTSFPPKEKAE